MAEFYYKNELVKLKVTESKKRITEVKFVNEYKPGETELSGIFRKEMDEYFSGDRYEFSNYYSLPGQKIKLATIYQQLMMIKYGSVVSYEVFARKVGYPDAIRYVATKIAENPLPILIPCHRVILKSGKYGQYQGGEYLKSYLIELERNSL